MLAMLGDQQLSDLWTHGRVLALIRADFAAQGAHRITLLIPGGVIPEMPTSAFLVKCRAEANAEWRLPVAPNPGQFPFF